MVLRSCRWYLASALSWGYRRVLSKTKALSQNDSVFTGIHVEASWRNQPVMEPTEPFSVRASTLCIIYISDLFITWSCGHVHISEIPAWVFLLTWRRLTTKGGTCRSFIHHTQPVMPQDRHRENGRRNSRWTVYSLQPRIIDSTPKALHIKFAFDSNWCWLIRWRCQKAGTALKRGWWIVLTGILK